MKEKAAAFVAKYKSLTPPARARVWLGLIALAVVLFLVFAPKPWTVPPPLTKPWKTAQYVTVYVWYALLADLLLIGLLAATAGWWTRTFDRSPADGRMAAPRWLWPLVGVAMLLNAWLCWPRLTHSFWHDETYPIRNAIVGTYKPRKDGSLKLNQVKWNETFFFYEKPNHTLYSGIARTVNDLWRVIARPQGLQFSEPVVRFPAYLAGIASVAAIAFLLNYLGYPVAAAIAAFLTALHPWHIRYASEARAYAFVLLILPLVVYYFLRAIESGTWRRWVAFGVSQFLLMYFYPTCVYIMVVLNLCAMAALWWRWGRSPGALTQWLRWVVVNVAGAMLFLPLMLPCVPQFLKYVKGTPTQGQLSYEWVTNFLAHLIAGIPWAYFGHSEPDSIELYPWFVAHPGLGVLAVFLALVFLAMGIRRLVARDRFAALLPIILLLPAAICYIETKARGGYVYEWYLLFLLPGVLALVAIGMDELVALAGTPAARASAFAFIILVIGSYTAWTTPQRDFLRAHSIQPNRESVLLTRPSLDPNDPRQKGIITATFYGPPEPYDPNIILFHNARELGELVHRADAEGKALYINLGYLTTVEGEHIHKYDLLRKSGLFEEVKLLPGLEPTLQSRHVFRYIPGRGANFDFSAVPADRGRPGSNYSY